MDKDGLVSIQLAAEASGVSAHTIRAWEKRYNALTPFRTEQGKRMYSAAEVARLKLLAQIIQFGTSISQVARLHDLELLEIYEKLTRTKARAFRPVSQASLNVSELLRDLVRAVKIFDVAYLAGRLEEARTSVDIRMLALDIITPFLREVKHELDHKTLSEAHLRTVIALVRFNLGTVINSHYEKNSKSPTRITLASLDQDPTDLNLLIAALLCCHYGKHIIYLSADLPPESVAEGVSATESNVLILHSGEEKGYRRTLELVSKNVDVWPLSSLSRDWRTLLEKLESTR